MNRKTKKHNKRPLAFNETAWADVMDTFDRDTGLERIKKEITNAAVFDDIT